MSHPEQKAFFTRVAEANQNVIRGGSILEIGSYDVNGTIRAIFEGSGSYLGLDLKDGPGVDLISYGHELESPDNTFDVSISGECFEHDPYWRETFSTMTRVTRPGGLVAFSCASLGRPEHGTRRTDKDDSPGTQAEGLDYYRNLTEADFAGLPLSDWFTRYAFWYVRSNRDLYFAGIKKGESPGRVSAKLPSGPSVEEIKDLMPLPDRIARLPLSLIERSTSDPARYQDRVLPYWLTMQKIFSHRRA